MRTFDSDKVGRLGKVEKEMVVVERLYHLYWVILPLERTKVI